LTTAALAVGSHMITAAYGGDANNLASTSAVLTQVVQQNTTTALTSSKNPAYSGGSVTFTAVVKGLVSGTPTGTVTFMDGTTSLGTGTLNSGTATFTTTSLSVGSHSITAVYGGDTLDVGSTSLAVSETINAADFSVTASPTTETITPGQTATYTFTITPLGSYTSPINFSCAGLPAFSSCSFSTNPVTPDAQTVTTTLTITTMGPNSAMTAPASPGGHGNTPAYALGTSAVLMSLVGMLLLGGGMKRKRELCKGLLIASAMLVVMGAMSACASNPGGNKNVTPAGTSTVTVTAAGGGSTSHNVSVTLVVQ